MKETAAILTEQFALDYHCSPEDFSNTDTLVTEYAPHPRARGGPDPDCCLCCPMGESWSSPARRS